MHAYTVVLTWGGHERLFLAMATSKFVLNVMIISVEEQSKIKIKLALKIPLSI